MSQRNERSIGPNSDRIIHWLICRAARGAPEALSSRLEEEWLADLESRSSALSRLRFALGCCWATVVIAGDFPQSRVAATSVAAAASSAAVTSSAVPARGFNSLSDRNFGYFSLRSGTLFLIAGLHAALFYGLITTLAHTNILTAPQNLQNVVVKPAPPEKLPILPADMKVKDWTINLKRLVDRVPPKVDVESEVTGQSRGQSGSVYASVTSAGGGSCGAACVRRTGRGIPGNGRFLSVAVDLHGGAGCFHGPSLCRSQRPTYIRADQRERQRQCAARCGGAQAGAGGIGEI